MEKVLVTGGLGFVGSHLVAALLKRGDNVAVVDNLSTSTVLPTAFNKFPGQFTFIQENLQTYLRSLNLEIPEFFHKIYHLASVVGPAGVLSHGGHIAIGVIEDTCALMDLAISESTQLIDISTSEVYGKTGLFSEDADKHIPGEVEIRTEYGVGKLAAEISMINRARLESLEFSIIRPFNIAGPRQKPDGGFVLPRFVIAALKNEPLTVFGDGNQVRAFTHVVDIIQGIMLVGDSDYKNEIWNVGNPANFTTISDLAGRVIKLVGSSSSIAHVDPRTLFGPLYAEAFNKLPVIAKIQRKLGWKPLYSLDQIIQETIEYWRERG